jgi:HPt (histidine-containing phosphotransfer) domain-containing protein
MTKTNPDELAQTLEALRPEIRQMLTEDLPADLKSAEQAYSREQWGALHNHVHRINGSASFCKLTNLKNLCSEIESGLKEERLPSPETMQEFSKEISRVLSALAAFVTAE